ncbi:MAG: hypothetical protein SFY70_10245 [Bacteroidia bacterium]|nr:hypothetical protein [Bacteroidia bacterium]
MPVFIEPTALLADQLDRLPPTLVQHLWREVEQANDRLANLLRQAETTRHATLERHQLLQRCLALACQHHGVEPALLRSPYKFQKLVFARAQLAAVLKELHQATQLEIGRLLCRDRSTISHTYTVHDNMFKTNPGYKATYLRLKADCSALCTATPLIATPQPAPATPTTHAAR